MYVYVLGTGIRLTHVDFGGRAKAGIDVVGDGNGVSDCSGHGTHVAGIIGGHTYGVAKGATLYAVQVFDCSPPGSVEDVIQGLDWVITHHQNNSVHPAVANMSLGGGPSPAEDLAVRNTIASGVTVVVSAGNNDDDACNYSPSRVTEAIVVGATDSDDHRGNFGGGEASNYGACVDIFAPGVQVASDTNTSDTAANTGNGTSYAAPFVAGRAALYLAHHLGSSPAAVQRNITNYSATNTYIADAGSASPQKIVYTFETLDRPSLQLEYTGCQYGIASYIVSWNGDYGPESESYDVDQMRSGVWSNFYSGGGKWKTLTVNSGAQFEIRVRYTVSAGTSAFHSSRLMTAPSCDTPPR